MLVFAGADLESAVAETMTAEFATSGQDCLGADWTHVERPVCDTFCAKSAEVTRTPTVQPRMDDRDIGALINVRKVGKGAMPACGGAGLPL